MKELFDQLRSAGFRITQARKAVVGLMHERRCALSVPEISELLAKRDMKPNLSTLYRELQFLTDQGVTQEVVFKDGVMRYELAESQHHHHLVCNNCEKIEAVELGEHLHAVEHSIQKSKRFQITSHSLEFYGICEKCS